jgi:hypothetical protein
LLDVLGRKRRLPLETVLRPQAPLFGERERAGAVEVSDVADPDRAAAAGTSPLHAGAQRQRGRGRNETGEQVVDGRGLGQLIASRAVAAALPTSVCGRPPPGSAAWAVDKDLDEALVVFGPSPSDGPGRLRDQEVVPRLASDRPPYPA